MKFVVLALALALALAAAPKVAAAAAAIAEANPLQLRPKAALVAAAPHNYAPFVTASALEPRLDLAPRREGQREQSRSSCNSDRDLCYDAASGHIVFKPARQFMPEIPGLQRENISVKRDRVILRYSF